MSHISELEKLADLRDKKIITVKEFEEQKKALLAYNLKDIEQDDTSDRKSRLAYLLLAWFLGMLGIHNFYAGYKGTATAQLLITLFLFWLIIPLIIVEIWVLIEMICVTKDAQGKPFTWP
jgi:TM2 domain-containing membrane protein YozV